MTRLLTTIIVFFMWISLMLLMVRFGFAPRGACEVRGRGPSTVVNCINLIQFKGDDFFSIYRISFPGWKKI